MNDISQSTLQDLLARIGQQDGKAFEQVYAHYHARVYAFVRHLHGHEADAQEITQDVFFALAQKPQAFSWQSSFGTWLTALAKNKVMDFWRKRGRQPRLESDDNHPSCDWADGSGDPQSQAIELEDEQAVERCREALPVEQKEALYWVNYMGTSVTQVAQLQQCPEGTVKSRLHKARQSVRLCLERWHGKGRL